MMGHVLDQEMGEQRTLQRRFWPVDPSVVMTAEDPDNLPTHWFQQEARRDERKYLMISTKQATMTTPGHLTLSLPRSES